MWLDVVANGSAMSLASWIKWKLGNAANHRRAGVQMRKIPAGAVLILEASRIPRAPERACAPGRRRRAWCCRSAALSAVETHNLSCRAW